MITNKEQSTKVYTTLDAYQAGFLTLRGHTPELIDQNGKVVFAFILSEQLLQNLSNYNNGATVEASKLAFAIKTLKSQIHSLRRDKGNNFGKMQGKGI